MNSKIVKINKVGINEIGVEIQVNGITYSGTLTEKISKKTDEFGISEINIYHAQDILCDNDDLGENSIREQIKKIIKAHQTQPNKIIDTIEDVIVWEKREFTTNCHEFLREIEFKF